MVTGCGQVRDNRERAGGRTGVLGRRPGWRVCLCAFGSAVPGGSVHSGSPVPGLALGTAAGEGGAVGLTAAGPRSAGPTSVTTSPAPPGRCAFLDLSPSFASFMDPVPAVCHIPRPSAALATCKTRQAPNPRAPWPHKQLGDAYVHEAPARPELRHFLHGGKGGSPVSRPVLAAIRFPEPRATPSRPAPPETARRTAHPAVIAGSGRA